MCTGLLCRSRAGQDGMCDGNRKGVAGKPCWVCLTVYGILSGGAKSGSGNHDDGLVDMLIMIMNRDCDG